MIRVTDGVLLIMVMLIAWSLYRAHRRTGFDFSLFDLIMENDRVSKVAVAFMVTLAITSWIMVRLALDQKMTEGYLIAYGGMWVAPIVAKMFKAESPSTITTTTESHKVEVKA